MSSHDEPVTSRIRIPRKLRAGHPSKVNISNSKVSSLLDTWIASILDPTVSTFSGADLIPNLRGSAVNVWCRRGDLNSGSSCDLEYHVVCVCAGQRAFSGLIRDPL